MKPFSLLRTLLTCSLLVLTGCGTAGPSAGPASPSPTPHSSPSNQPSPTPEPETGSQPQSAPTQMQLEIDGQVFLATLADNAAVDELVALLSQQPVTIQMQDFSGFEKVGPLGQDLPTENSQTTTTAGDIVLYQGNQIVIFYGSNSWSYTRLGHIDDLTGWEKALGSGDVTVTFSLPQS